MKYRKYKVRVSVSRTKSIKYILRKLKSVKRNKGVTRKETKIHERVKMSNGKYKTMDTRITFTMTREEALRTGFIREV